jgi:hypothetical protein
METGLHLTKLHRVHTPSPKEETAFISQLKVK